MRLSKEELDLEYKLMDEIAGSKFSWNTFVKCLKLMALTH